MYCCRIRPDYRVNHIIHACWSISIFGFIVRQQKSEATAADASGSTAWNRVEFRKALQNIGDEGCALPRGLSGAKGA
jgi:hypothetical protein